MIDYSFLGFCKFYMTFWYMDIQEKISFGILSPAPPPPTPLKKKGSQISDVKYVFLKYNYWRTKFKKLKLYFLMKDNF